MRPEAAEGLPVADPESSEFRQRSESRQRDSRSTKLAAPQRLMLRRLVVAALVAVGLGLVARGIDHRLTARAVGRVADSFIAAVLQGDREAMLSHLTPELRSKVETGGGESWTHLVPQLGVRCRLRAVELVGIDAAVPLRLEKDGFRIEPVLHLRRREPGVWQITRIDKIDIDPRWLDLQREHARIENEKLARELTEALKNHPGVTVERGDSADSPLSEP